MNIAAIISKIGNVVGKLPFRALCEKSGLGALKAAAPFANYAAAAAGVVVVASVAAAPFSSAESAPPAPSMPAAVKHGERITLSLDEIQCFRSNDTPYIGFDSIYRDTLAAELEKIIKDIFPLPEHATLAFSGEFKELHIIGNTGGWLSDPWTKDYSVTEAADLFFTCLGYVMTAKRAMDDSIRPSVFDTPFALDFSGLKGAEGTKELSLGILPGLEYLVLPNGITKLSGPAHAENLKSVALPKTITSITGFLNTGLESITFHEGITEISAFKGSKNLKSVKLPKTLRYISGFDKSAIESIVLPEGVIEVFGFSDTENLKSVKLPKTLTYIDGFYKSAIESVVLPEGITEIDSQSFSDCENLESITLPESLEIIRGSAFANTPNLKTVNYRGSKEMWRTIEFKENYYGKTAKENLQNDRVTIKYNAK